MPVQANASAVASTLMAEVLRRIKPAALAAELEDRGLSGPHGRYAAPTIYRWAAGGIMPSADVLLEAARIAELSIDAYLYGYALEAEVSRAEFEALRDTVAELQHVLASHVETIDGGKTERKRRVRP